MAAGTSTTREAGGQLAQLEFLDLAGRGLGQFLEHHRLGVLNPASRSRAKAISSASLALGAVLQLDEGAGHLAPFLVRAWPPRRTAAPPGAHQRALDLDRADVLAARDDDVLRAVGDLDIAVGMLHGDVAGVEIAARESLGRGLGVLVGSPSSPSCRGS
jgi:hypothetical protein